MYINQYRKLWQKIFWNHWVRMGHFRGYNTTSSMRQWSLQQNWKVEWNMSTAEEIVAVWPARQCIGEHNYHKANRLLVRFPPGGPLHERALILDTMWFWRHACFFKSKLWVAHKCEYIFFHPLVCEGQKGTYVSTLKQLGLIPETPSAGSWGEGKDEIWELN